MISQPLTKDEVLKLKPVGPTSRHGGQSPPLPPPKDPLAGGQPVTLTPLTPRGIRFARVSTRDDYSMARHQDGSLHPGKSNENTEPGDGTTCKSRTIKVDVPDEALTGFIWSWMGRAPTAVWP